MLDLGHSRVGGQSECASGEENFKADKLVPAVVQVNVHEIFRVVNVFTCRQHFALA